MRLYADRWIGGARGEHGAALLSSAHAGDEIVFALGVELGDRFVEEEDRRVASRAGRWRDVAD